MNVHDFMMKMLREQQAAREAGRAHAGIQYVCGGCEHQHAARIVEGAGAADSGTRWLELPGGPCPKCKRGLLMLDGYDTELASLLTDHTEREELNKAVTVLGEVYSGLQEQGIGEHHAGQITTFFAMRRLGMFE